MTKISFYVLLVLGLVALSAGWMAAGYLPFGLLILLLLPVTLIFMRRKYLPTLGFLLISVVVLAAVGVWARLSFWLMLAALMCTLAAWDLDEFSRRLVLAPVEDNPLQLERQHLYRLGLVLGLGLGLNLLSQLIRIESGFEWSLVLAVLAFVGISTLVMGLKNREE